MNDPLNIDPIRQQSDWYALREKYRKLNESRVKKSLRPVLVPYRHLAIRIFAACACGTPVSMGEWRVTLYRESGKLLSDYSRHRMEDKPEPVLGDLRGNERLELAERLSGQAENAAMFDSVTIPGGEDYDGPAIYDLHNEEEVLAVVDSMVKAGEAKKLLDTKQSENAPDE